MCIAHPGASSALNVMPRNARILIVGGGGIGVAAALNLEDGGFATTTLVLRSNYDVVKKSGFTIESVNHGKRVGWRPTGTILPKVPNVLEEGLQPFDFILSCTKNIPDIPPILPDILRPAVTPGHSVIVLVQNGLYIERPILQAFPDNICLSGISFCGAEESLPGHIMQNETDQLDIGPFPGNSAEEKAIQAAQELVRMYSASGKVKSSYNSDVKYLRWRKLLLNVAYNPISALTNLDTSRLRLSSLDEKNGGNIVDDLLKPAMMEVISAARAVDDVQLDEELINITIEGDPIEDFIRPSMQQDFLKGRFNECENILGEVVRAASNAGLETPIVRTLYCLCKAVQFKSKEACGMVDLQALLSRYQSKQECAGTMHNTAARRNLSCRTPPS